MSSYRVESGIIRNPADVERDWHELQGRAGCSYFQSWGWIGTWLEVVADDLKPVLVRVWSGELTVGLAIFVNRHVKRHGVIRSHASYLQEFPFDGRNMAIEYNGILADPGHAHAVYREIIGHLFDAPGKPGELFFGAMDSSVVAACFPGPDLVPGLSAGIGVLESSVYWMVDLDRIGRGLDAYLDSLDGKRRAQIRRSIRLYQQQGRLELTAAESTTEALAFLDGLKELHTRRWNVRGQGGAFANPRWEAFHRALIQRRFRAGEIQFLKIRVADLPVGYLYNLVWRRHVYVLQTGFRMSPDKRLMPGYVSHALAVAYNRDRGMHVYDLMHGDSLYKRLLCNRTGELQWIVVQRRHLRYVLENLLLGMARRIRRTMRTRPG